MIKPIPLIFFVFVFFFSGLSAFSQTDPLTKRATLQVQNEPLENIFAAITQQTGVRFSYNSQLLNPKTKVTINVQNKTIKEILPKIIPASVSYKKVGAHIVFLPKEKSETQKTDKLNDEITKVEMADEEIQEAEKEKIEKKDSLDNGKLMDDCLNDVSKSEAAVVLTENTVNLAKDTISLTKEEEMKAQIAGILMAVATASAPVAVAQDTAQMPIQEEQLTVAKPLASMTAQDATSMPIQEEQLNVAKPLAPVVAQDTTQIKVQAAQLTFIYPLGTGFVKSAERCYHFSLNILGGVTGQVKGFEAGGIFNINKYGATGAQFAGIFNLSLANNPALNSRNAQFAGIFNHTQKGKSAQFAGVFNIGDTAYLQAGGIFNIAHNAAAQFAGISNYANNAKFQAAGIVNISSKTAFQGAGIVNVAQESACQIAGIVNVTKKGRFQMGVINVRDTADGVSLGVINIVKHGGIMEAGIDAGELVHTAVSFRSGVQRLYSILSVGYNYTDKFWSVGAGLGTSFKLIGNLSLNLELTHAALYMNEWRETYPYQKSLTQFAPILNYRFAKHFKIYAGPSLNLLHQYGMYGDHKIKAPYSLAHYDYPADSMLDLWIGVVGGIKF